jgi:hypothetical protein
MDQRIVNTLLLAVKTAISIGNTTSAYVYSRILARYARLTGKI